MSQSKTLFPKELAAARTLPACIRDVSDYHVSSSLFFLNDLRQILEYYLQLSYDPLFPHSSNLLFSYDAVNQADTDSVVELNTDY